MNEVPGFTVRVADWQRDQAALRSIRNEVFVTEQRVPETLEWDDLDATSLHALALDSEGRAIACARLLHDGHIGRVAVRASWRKRGVGAAVVLHMMELARSQGHRVVILNAQTQALPFYARLGFVRSGPDFEEAGIPHCEMRYVAVA
jgi:predicted GNAT family N-acyltransferase